MPLAELLEAYYESHIIFIDPKHATTSENLNNLLDIMDSLPGSTDRLIAKYYGVTTYWPLWARERGYKTWGYFYESDSANFATYEDRWDILGLNHEASNATWTTMLGFGKPVVAHLVATTAHAQTALSNGAAGLMVSGVQQAIERSSSSIVDLRR